MKEVLFSVALRGQQKQGTLDLLCFINFQFSFAVFFLCALEKS